MTPAIKTALDKGAEIVARRNAIVATLDRERANVRTLEITREEARANLTAAESSAAIQQRKPDEKTRKAFTAAESELTFAAARVEGLEGTLRLLDDELTTARAATQVEIDNYLEQQRQAALARFRQAAAVFGDELHHALGVFGGLSARREMRSLADVIIHDPEDRRNVLVRGDGRGGESAEAAKVCEEIRATRTLLSPPSPAPIPAGEGPAIDQKLYAAGNQPDSPEARRVPRRSQMPHQELEKEMAELLSTGR